MEKIHLNPELIGKRIILRKHELSLAKVMFEYVESDRDRLDRFLPWVKHVKTVQDEENYIHECLKDWDNFAEYNYGIFKSDDYTYMGNIATHSILWDHDCAEIGYWILGKFEGQGYVSEAVSLLDQHLFELGFHRIQIRCNDLNCRSENVPRRCGYTFEGIAREDRIEKGKYRNSKTFSKLSSDP